MIPRGLTENLPSLGLRLSLCSRSCLMRTSLPRGTEQRKSWADGFKVDKHWWVSNAFQRDCWLGSFSPAPCVFTLNTLLFLKTTAKSKKSECQTMAFPSGRNSFKLSAYNHFYTQPSVNQLFYPVILLLLLKRMAHHLYAVQRKDLHPST